MKLAILPVLCFTMMVALVHAQDKLPRYEPAPCPFEGAEDRDDVKCGYLVVAENRDHADRRTLRLAVAVLKSLSDNPQDDPLVYLSGGPGGPSVKYTMSRLNSSFWNRYRQKRDLVFFDQRGTGFSDPDFCPEMNFSLQTSNFRGLSLPQQQSLVNEAVSACRKKVVARGIDFAFYNSATSALDLDDLRNELGYRKWNLFGISYGTRLALTAMRDTPEGIRSVIIDSNWPPNAPIADDKKRLMRSLNLVFEQCDANPQCKATFPQLEREFFAALDDYKSNPVVLELDDLNRFPDGRIVVDGSLLAYGVFQGLYDRNFIGIFPLLVREVRARNANVLAALADGLVKEAGFNSGLQLAVNCYEWRARESTKMANADQLQNPALHVWQPYGTTPVTCDAWHQQRAGVIERQAVHSNIPALIAQGEFDPITPPSYGKLTAASLPNSTYIEVPAEGHAATPFTDCTRDILEAFLDQPTAPPNTGCIAKMPAASFTTDVYMNTGVYQLAKLLQGQPTVSRMAGFGLTVLLLLSTIVIWPVIWIVRRMRKQQVSSTPATTVARWLAVVTALTGLGFLFGLGGVILKTAQENPFLLGFGVPGNTASLFVLPWVSIPATICVLIFAGIAWKQRWWGLSGRVHYSLVAIACVNFIAEVLGLGLI